MTKEFHFGDWKEGTNKDTVKVISHGEIAREGCPNCTEKKDLSPTGKMYNGDRVYLCQKCKKLFASQTTYAECSNEWVNQTKGSIIASDLVSNDCLICPIPKREGFDIHELIKQGKACPYFKKVIGNLKPGDIK